LIYSVVYNNAVNLGDSSVLYPGKRRL